MARPALLKMGCRLAGAIVGARTVVVVSVLMAAVQAAAGGAEPAGPTSTDAPMPDPCALAPTLPFCPRSSP